VSAENAAKPNFRAAITALRADCAAAAVRLPVPRRGSDASLRRACAGPCGTNQHVRQAIARPRDVRVVRDLVDRRQRGGHQPFLFDPVNASTATLIPTVPLDLGGAHARTGAT
jgi:hypothetical protein